MNLIIHLLLISSLSILIIKSDPNEGIKRRIKRFIAYEGTRLAADTSTHNLGLEKNGCISESYRSVIWKGTHNKNETVAVKIIGVKQKYFNEVERLAALDAENPEIELRGIPRVFYGGPFLVYYHAIAMTFFEETLKDRRKKQLKQNMNISELSILLIFRRGVEILEYLNERNIVHNDIKPANIFLRGQEVFIGGFEQASLHGDTEVGCTLEFASSNWYGERKRCPMDDLESLVFSLWYVAKIPWDSQPEGKTLWECKNIDERWRENSANKKMLEKSEKFKDPNVQEAMKLICSVEMLRNQQIPDYKQIIKILDNAIRKVHRDLGTPPRFEWL